MVAQKKYELIEKLVRTEDDWVLNQIQALLEGTDVEVWNELDPKLKASIERGLDQSKHGNLKPHEEIMKEFRSRIS